MKQKHSRMDRRKPKNSGFLKKSKRIIAVLSGYGLVKIVPEFFETASNFLSYLSYVALQISKMTEIIINSYLNYCNGEL